MIEETDRLIFIFDETETYIDSDLEFPNIQRRVLYDLVVDYIELTQTIDEFTELLRCICNYTKDSMPILDRTYSKSKIISIMTDNIFKAFGIEKIKGLKIQIDPNYDEKIVQFCEEIVTYEFDDIITSKQKGIPKYSFTDYKINKCSSFILAAYTDTMYKVSLFISYQYYLDPNTQDNIMGKMRSKIDDDSYACFDVLLEQTYNDIHLNYEFRSVFSDDISATELKKWFLADMMVHGGIIMYVNYSTLHILNCIEEHIKKSSCEENVTSEQNLYRALCKISSLCELKKIYDTLIPELDFDYPIFRYREITRYEKFFVIYEHEVTEDSLSRWQEYIISVEKKIDEIDRFVNEPIPQDDL